MSVAFVFDTLVRCILVAFSAYCLLRVSALVYVNTAQWWRTREQRRCITVQAQSSAAKAHTMREEEDLYFTALTDARNYAHYTIVDPRERAIQVRLLEDAMCRHLTVNGGGALPPLTIPEGVAGYELTEAAQHNPPTNAAPPAARA